MLHLFIFPNEKHCFHSRNAYEHAHKVTHGLLISANASCKYDDVQYGVEGIAV